MRKYVTTHQYAPLRAPSSWSTEERRLLAQLTEVFDDVYRRFGRLRFEDLSTKLRTRIEDDEGNIAELEVTTGGLSMAVNNNRLAFDESGLTILNAEGETVLAQDNETGNLTIAGVIHALAGGVIGGFTIGESALSNGDSIYLGSEGLIRLGELMLQDTAGYGPTLHASGGIVLHVGDADAMTLNQSAVQAKKPFHAMYGLHANPARTTTQAANVYMDPATGELRRVVGAVSTLTVTVTTDKTSAVAPASVTWVVAASGGTAPYTYNLALYKDGVFFVNAPFPPTFEVNNLPTGSYYAVGKVTDAANSTAQVTGGYVTVTAAGAMYAHTLGTNVNMRNSYGTIGTTVVYQIAAQGTQVQVTGGRVLCPTDNYYWYPCYCNGYNGWIRSDLISVPQ